MKVLFLYPDIASRTPHYYQMGIGMLSGALKRAGADRSLYHLAEMPSEEQFCQRIQQEKPDLLAISTTSGQWRFVVPMIRWAKAHFGLQVIAGGIHPTLAPHETLMQAPELDAICIGEGEDQFVQYVHELGAGNRRPTGLANFWLKTAAGGWEQNPMGPLVEDLDRLGWPDHELFDFSRVIEMMNGEANVMAGRGCPYRCSYCSNEVKIDQNRELGSNLRWRTPEDVVRECEYVRDTYGNRTFYFIDDIFTLNREWTKAFARIYGDRVRMPFRIQLQVKTIDAERLELLRDVGLYSVVAGVETGNEELRKKVLIKRISNDDIRKCFREADRLGIETATYNIIGIPGETEQTVRDSIGLNREIRPNRTIVTIFTPFPGTSLYREAKEQGILRQDTDPSYFDENSFLDLPTISRERLLELYREFARSGIEIAEEKARRGYYDLLQNRGTATVVTPDPSYVYVAAPKLNYEERSALCAHPPTRLIYRVGVKPDSRLRFGIGIAPEVWNRTDGVRFRIYAGGRFLRTLLFDRSLTPKTDPSHRAWHHFDLDLSAFGGKTVRIELRTDPVGSPDYSSAYWAAPHLACANDPIMGTLDNWQVERPGGASRVA